MMIMIIVVLLIIKSVLFDEDSDDDDDKDYDVVKNHNDGVDSYVNDYFDRINFKII